MDHLPIHSPRGDHRPVTHHPGLSRGELRSAGAAGLVVPRPHQLSFLGMNILTGNHWETMVFTMKYRAFRFQCSHPILWNMMKLFVEWILLTVFLWEICLNDQSGKPIFFKQIYTLRYWCSAVFFLSMFYRQFMFNHWRKVLINHW